MEGDFVFEPADIIRLLEDDCKWLKGRVHVMAEHKSRRHQEIRHSNSPEGETWLFEETCDKFDALFVEFWHLPARP